MAFSADVPPRLPDPHAADALSEDSPRLEEPVILEHFKWPIAALWISLGLHGALIAWVHIAPPPSVASRGSIQARLVSLPAAPALAPARLTPSIENPETLPVAVADIPPVAVEAPSAEPVTERPLLPSPPEPRIPRLEIPLAVDLHYYTARELDQTPNGNLPEPLFPDALSGRIRFEVKIEEDGRVSEVTVMQTEPADIFDDEVLENAIEALRMTQFTPAIKNARPVRAVVIYELTINPVPAQTGIR